MTTYRVALSDRKRERSVEAYGPCDAIRQAVGKRFAFSRQESRDPLGYPIVFEVGVATSARRYGETPFRNIRAYVSLEEE